MAYIGTSPSNGVRRKHTYTATASQTSFSGAGAEGATLSYSDSNFVDVYQNGVKLADEDYTATSGTAIVLAQGASADDIVEIIAFDVFSVADTVSKADGGTFDGDVTMAGTFTSLGIDDNATSTAITIDSSENVGIGTSSMTRFFNLNDTGANPNTAYFKSTNASGGAGLTAYNDGGQASIFQMNGGSYTALGGANTLNIGTVTNNRVVFVENNTERMRIIGTQFFINCTAAPSATVAGVRLGNPAVALCAFSCGSPTTEVYQLGFYNGNGLVGRISTNGSSTSYTTSSDYRLKENVITEWDATTRLKQLKPSRFNFIADANTTVDGFLAHEVQSVVPEAISGTKDATRDIGIIRNEDGDINAENAPQVQANTDENETWEKIGTENVYQSIDQSKLVPLLVKTIQELEARITALENA